jgi:8-oxo-dGTP pyrophosphatase MutT (NUDIX family)
MKNINSNKVFFYTIGSIPDKKIYYITAMGKYKNKWVLIQKRNTKIYEFPGGKRLNQEKVIDTLAREVKEEIGANINRAIPISLYRFISYRKDYYGLVYYCDFNDLDGTYDQSEISDIKLVSKIKNSQTQRLPPTRR